MARGCFRKITVWCYRNILHSTKYGFLFQPLDLAMFRINKLPEINKKGGHASNLQSICTQHKKTWQPTESNLKKNAVVRWQQNSNRTMILCDGSVKLQSGGKKAQQHFKSDQLIDISVGMEWLTHLPVWEGMSDVIFLLDMTHYEGWLGTVGSRLRKLSCCKSLCSSPRGKAIDRKGGLGQHRILKTEGKEMGGL